MASREELTSLKPRTFHIDDAAPYGITHMLECGCKLVTYHGGTSKVVDRHRYLCPEGKPKRYMYARYNKKGVNIDF